MALRAIVAEVKRPMLNNAQMIWLCGSVLIALALLVTRDPICLMMLIVVMIAGDSYA